MPTVTLLTVAEARARRNELIDSLPLPEEEFRFRASQFELTPEELAIATELDALDFLLGA